MQLRPCDIVEELKLRFLSQTATLHIIFSSYLYIYENFGLLEHIRFELANLHVDFFDCSLLALPELLAFLDHHEAAFSSFDP